MSIKIKLFLILSALMALILVVQFFLAYQAQKDLLVKLGDLSKNINTAIDSHYAQVLQDIQDMERFELKTEKLLKDSTMFIDTHTNHPESLYFQVISELKHVREAEKILRESYINSPEYSEDYLMKFESEFPNEIEKLMENLEIADKDQKLLMQKRFKSAKRKIRDIEMHEMPVIISQDSNRRKISVSPMPHIETIDIHVGKSQDKVRSVIKISPKIIHSDVPPHGAENFILRIPDFSLPDKPKLIRYNYQSAEIEEALNSSLKRNIIITITLFAFSILAILFISRRFLKPIGVLQNSFDQVIAGNLDVAVSVKTRDEMAHLTHAFNHMVGELQKNREKEKLLQQKERLASMGQLAAGVAHEIKNPLNAINLTIEHLRDKYAQKDKTAKKYIQTIQSEISRLDTIVDNFLNFLRSEYLKKIKTDLNELISEVLNLLGTEISAADIKIEFNTEKPFITEVDPERFKTVLLNIFLNATHAMPDGGIIKISTDTQKKMITVEDNGAGIPAENVEKIFDLFYTTKSKGTGLGLPTAYKIVKEHGGEISITSQEGKGTQVSIIL
jgi:signal transduction histidine kinase